MCLRLITILCCFLSIMSQSALSQCPECEIDYDCGTESELPTVCPQLLPAAVAGEYYEESITFYLPQSFQDPESGVDVELLEVFLQSILGLPFGMEITLDEEDGVYEPANGQEYGCATICGTPLLAGTYVIDINIMATVLVFGSIETEAPQTFTVPFLVEAGENANQSFTFDNLAACDSLTVTFEALIDGSPNNTYYYWNFGNGNTSDLQFPPAQLYSEPGEYLVTLTTEITQPVLNEVVLEGVGGGWFGDTDEPFDNFLFAPDPYFSLFDGSGSAVYTSSPYEEVEEAVWSDLGLPLTNPPYSIVFYDEDTFSDDDQMGTVSLDLQFGSQDYNENGTEGSLTVNEEVYQSFYNEEAVTVFPSPDANFQVDEENNILFYSDPLLVNYGWVLNGLFLSTETDSLLVMNSPGVYSAVVENIYGCQAESQEYVLCPEPQISVNSNTHELSVNGNYLTYQWFLNGELIDGATDPTYTATEDGNYSVHITTSYGCEVTSETLFVSLMVFEIVEDFDLKLFPNPADDYVTVEIQKFGNVEISCRILDSAGKTVMWIAKSRDLFSEKQRLDLSGLRPGLYFVEFNIGPKRITRPLAIR